MSVTPETHQLAMAPYFAVAAAELESYSVTAVCREALSAKVLRLVHIVGGGGGGGGGEGGGGGGGGEGGEGGGGVLWCAAESTDNHCGGTALLSDRRAWAVELGTGEILGLMVVAPSRARPCASL